MPVLGDNQKKKPQPGGAVPVVNEIVGRVNDNTKRLRLLEQREKIIASRTTSMDESINAKLEYLENARKDLDTKIVALDEKVTTVNNTLREVVKQFQFLVKKSEFKKIEEKMSLFDSLISRVRNQGNEQG